MKKSKLKPLVKAILMEMYKKQLNEWSSGTVDDYEIEFDSLVIPGITNETDAVMATINIDYEANPGSPARGMFGPPEHSSPAEGAEVSILDWDIVLLTITPEHGQPTQIDDFKSWTPEQWKALKKPINDYMQSNEGKIQDQILDKLGDVEPEEPDHEDDYFDDR